MGKDIETGFDVMTLGENSESKPLCKSMLLPLNVCEKTVFGEWSVVKGLQDERDQFPSYIGTGYPIWKMDSAKPLAIAKLQRKVHS